MSPVHFSKASSKKIYISFYARSTAVDSGWLPSVRMGKNRDSGIVGHSSALPMLLWALQISHHLERTCASLLCFSEVTQRCTAQPSTDTIKC